MFLIGWDYMSDVCYILAALAVTLIIKPFIISISRLLSVLVIRQLLDFKSAIG